MERHLLKYVYVSLLPIGLFACFMAMAKGFGFHSIPIVVSQSMIPLVIGDAAAITMRMELFDFSPGVRVVFASVIGGMLEHRFGAPGLLFGCMLTGIVGGYAIAILYRVLRIPAMVVSLGFILIFEVFGAKIAGTSGYIKISEASAFWGSYPINIIISLVSCVLFYIIIYRTKIGCHLHAVGNDEKMAKSLGIDTERVKFRGFVLSGIFCGIAAILLISYSASITAQIGMVTMSMVFKPIIGVLIGMQLIKIVDNLAFAILIGALAISVIFNGFIALGLTDTAQNIVLGLFLIIVMAVSANTTSKSAMDVPAKAKK
jgi:ribose transport system permease protein